MSSRKQRPIQDQNSSSPALPTTPLLSENDRKPTGAAAKATRSIPRRATQTYLRIVGLTGVLVLIYVVFFRGQPKNEEQDPNIPIEGDYTLRIVAVGDLHSDFQNTLKVLQRSHVVDNKGDWSGEIDYLVQTGDIIDRGNDTLEIYRFMEKLRVQARHLGGNVFSHLGNHEYMNALGDWRYVYPSEIETFGGVAKRQFALSLKGFPGAAWATNYTTVSRIPLHPTSGAPNADYAPNTSPLSHAAYSFMHGGISPHIAKQYGTPYPSRLNDVGASLLRRCQTRKPPPPHPPAPYHGLPSDSPREEHDFYGAEGPVWYRGWAELPDQVVCSAVDQVIELIGVKRLIMGHTPNFKRSACIYARICLIRSNTGISRAYNGAISALSITYTLSPILSSFETEIVVSSNSNATTFLANSTESYDTTNITSTNTTTPQAQTSPSIDGGRRVGKWKEREHIQALYYPNRVQDLVIDERVIVGDFWV
ncbi:hypothetical protein Clacol_009097 [Clathrus columnatus]|uniref:Calcineurin-like phosphoesterase domain-containing protein n=1 Tax=Clathrus columnatus TaxID=1419009 RepID=A0AAV5AQ46_9AGAM|nr:hypothetical protein Clacol_009097 [Clathrus columnatus]